MATKNKAILWLDAVQEHDYPAAESYLRLIYDDKHAKQVVNKLRKTKIVEFKAKDIFRASSLSLLGVSNSHVDKDSKKIAKGTALSPLLLVRDSKLGKVIIADGYHRMCAIYLVNEDALIRCKIV
jgi:disulfide oxidoreductase YuzD